MQSNKRNNKTYVELLRQDRKLSMQRNNMLLRLSVGILSALAIAAASAAAAQDYPNRVIRIISPVPAGGLSDIAMRPMALELQRR